jgi:transcriptional regulator with XRE-family HTH domain
LPTSPRESLGNKLRDLRLRAGLSGDALAAQTGLSQSKVSRIETGRGLPSLEEVQAWAAATNASADELRELAGLVEQVATSATSWRILHRLGLAAKQHEVEELEREAARIYTFQPSMIPGLLQVPEYARRLLATGFPDQDHARAVAARMERQAILYETSKQFEFLLTEGAITWGWDDLRAAQLDRLTSVASLPNVTVLVVAPSSTPFLHPFVMWDLADETLVTVETYSAEMTVADTQDIQTYREVWQRLADGATEWSARRR